MLGRHMLISGCRLGEQSSLSACLGFSCCQGWRGCGGQVPRVIWRQPGSLLVLTESGWEAISWAKAVNPRSRLPFCLWFLK